MIWNRDFLGEGAIDVDEVTPKEVPRISVTGNMMDAEHHEVDVLFCLNYEEPNRLIVLEVEGLVDSVSVEQACDDFRRAVACRRFDELKREVWLLMDDGLWLISKGNVGGSVDCLGLDKKTSCRTKGLFIKISFKTDFAAAIQRFGSLAKLMQGPEILLLK